MAPKVKPKRKRHLTRDSILFFGGLLGVAHETVIAETERPGLLFLFAGMLGLPAFLNKDELA